ncbi:hypothetical protein [Capillibacterium thermochitinicola]|uniref:hypothetical protein n=1 Tax=Capillibacterium thermochitinicola TaxID=2699427 RepID=UPI001E339214|nr:hypothetical protein [Capillibacterium thermochitinicola]
MIGLRAEAMANVFGFPSRNQVEQALHSATENWGPLVCLEGEITDVTADGFRFRASDHEESFFSHQDAEVFVNGRAGLCTALRPIAPGFNFDARLYLDRAGVLRLVDGWYVGVEAEVLTIDPERGLLTVQPLDHAQANQFRLSPLFSATSPLPAPGEVCFFLFDWEYQVRRIICAP